MRWGYITGAGGKPPVPLSLSIQTHCHALITGSSGSGKSYTILYLLGCLLQDAPEIVLYFCDFKNSEDFAFLKGYPYYFSGNDCYEGVMKYYESFCHARITGKATRHILIFDEYPAFINYLSTKDKQEKTKKAGDILGAVAEILMLGRGMGCYAMWMATQRAEASLFVNGARDNFMVVLGLGRMSKEQKGMVFAGEEVPNKVYHRGEGCLLADGHPLYEITIPRIRNVIDWKKHIREILMENCK